MAARAASTGKTERAYERRQWKKDRLYPHFRDGPVQFALPLLNAGGRHRLNAPRRHSHLPGDFKDRRDWGKTRDPVSYTHLDVYKRQGYDYIILATGASKPGVLKLEAGDAMNALDFLAQFKATDGNVNIGKNVVVIGGGNTAMDTARACLLYTSKAS